MSEGNDTDDTDLTGFTMFHCIQLDTCEHEWGGWRTFEDGRGGEQVCKKCGMGAMAHSLRYGD